MDLDDGRVMFGDATLETNTTVVDPVCGTELERTDAEAAADYRGTVYYFCSMACKERFIAAPERYVTAAASP